MNKMKKILVVFMVVVMSAFTFACGGGGGETTGDTTTEEPEKVETVVWDFIDLDSNVHPMIILLREWSDTVYERTDGRLKINIRVGGELPFTTGEYLDAASAGSVQMAGCMVNPIASYLQAGGLPGGCYLISSTEACKTVMDVLNPYLEDELAPYGVMNLFTTFHPSQDLYGRGEAPGSVDDLQGMLLRTSGAEQAKFWKACGLSPMSIDASEVMSALNKNVIDGLTTAVVAVDLNKWYEALDWMYVCNSQWIPQYNVVNLEAFNDLPEDVQQILLDTSKEFEASFLEKMTEYADQSVENLKSYGIEVVYATDEQKAELTQKAIPLWEAYAESVGGNAPEAVEEIKAALGL